MARSKGHTPFSITREFILKSTIKSIVALRIQGERTQRRVF